MHNLRIVIKQFLFYLAIFIIVTPFVKSEQYNTTKFTIINIELHENLSIEYKYSVGYCAIGNRGLYNEILDRDIVDPFIFQEFSYDRPVDFKTKYVILDNGECRGINFSHNIEKAISKVQSVGKNYETIYFRQPFFSKDSFQLNQKIEVTIKLPYSFSDYNKSKQLILLSAPNGERFTYDKNLNFTLFNREYGPVEMIFGKSGYTDYLTMIAEFSFILKNNEDPIFIQEIDNLEYPGKNIIKTFYVKNNFKDRNIYYGIKDPFENVFSKTYYLQDTRDLGTLTLSNEIKPHENKLIDSLKREDYFDELPNCNLSIIEKFGYPFDCKILKSQNTIASNFDLNNTPFNTYFDYGINLILKDNFVVDNYHLCIIPRDIFYPQMPFYDGAEFNYIKENGTIISRSITNFKFIEPYIITATAWNCTSRILEPGAGIRLNYAQKSNLVESDSHDIYFYLPIYINNKIFLSKVGNSWRSNSTKVQLRIPYKSYEVQYNIMLKRDFWFSILLPFIYAITVPITFFYLKRHKSLINKNKKLYYLFSFVSTLLVWTQIYQFLGNPINQFFSHKSLWLMLVIMLSILIYDLKNR